MEITPFVVAHSRIDNFKASNWHEDYTNRSFTIEPGSVLAIDLPVSYWVVAADETPISSVFQVAADENMAPGTWSCDWQRDPDLVTILLHPAERERFPRSAQPRGRESNCGVHSERYLLACPGLAVNGGGSGRTGRSVWSALVRSAYGCTCARGIAAP